MRIKATCPSDKTATILTAKFNLPKDTTSCTFELPKGTRGQTAQHNLQDNKGEWTINKFSGGHEHNIVCKITLKSPCATKARNEVGPISLNFEIPMFNVSKLCVKYLKI